MMGNMVRRGEDFYEEDEAVGEIVAIFEKGKKALTGQPPRGGNQEFHLTSQPAVVVAPASDSGTSAAFTKMRLLST